MKRRQRTLAHDAVCTGVGLFEGKNVRLVLKGAPENHGIVFVRTDVAGSPRVQASVANLAPDNRRTSLQAGVARVSTVEHLLAALYAFHVDNAAVLIDGPEPPVMDGSALPFAELIRETGTIEQTAERSAVVPKTPLRIQSDEARIEVTPLDHLKLTYELLYPGGRFGPQTASFDVNPEAFAEDIAPARSFLLEEEIAAIMAQGLGKGGTAENTVVIGPKGPNEGLLRFPNEPARHKVLDLLGDLCILNADLLGHVHASRSGHSLNHALAKELNGAMETSKPQSIEPLLDIEEIQKILPHRYPFLLVDRVVELELGKRALGYKNVSANEHFFVGHFPQKKLMPGVLQLEAMAQLAGVLMLQKLNSEGKLAVLLSMDEVKFRRAVVPGDRLMLEAVALKMKTRTGQVQCTASVDGQVASQAIINFMLVDLKETKSDNTQEA